MTPFRWRFEAWLNGKWKLVLGVPAARAGHTESEAFAYYDKTFPGDRAVTLRAIAIGAGRETFVREGATA